MSAIDPAFPRFETLGSGHDRSAFSCGVPELDEYLKALAGQHSRKKISATTVLLVDGPTQIAGYHTLSSSRLSLGQLPSAVAKHYPRYAEGIPAILLGRLAVDLSYRGKRWGEALLIDALVRSYRATTVVSSAFVIVRATDAPATEFYARFGFKEFPGDSRRLFMAMKTIRQLARLNIPYAGHGQ